MSNAESEGDDFNSRMQLLIRSHTHMAYLIRFADVKAAMIMGWTSTMFGGLSAGACDEYIRPGNLSLTQFTWGATGLGILACGAFGCLAWSFICAVSAFNPRSTGEEEPGYFFWKSILAHGDNFKSAASGAAKQELLEHLAEHLQSIANICDQKYKQVGNGVLFGLGGSVAAAILIVLT